MIKNLKTEEELISTNVNVEFDRIAKLDQLVTHQWQRLLEIQRLQLELLGERAGKLPRGAES